MGFNNGLERRKFEAEWKKLRVEYAAAGMEEAAIEKMYQFDLKVLLSNRRYGEHKQSCPFCFSIIALKPPIVSDSRQLIEPLRSRIKMISA